MVNWNPFPSVGLTGSMVAELSGMATRKTVQALGDIGSEASNGAMRIAQAVPDEKPDIAVLERPEEAEDIPVPEGEDHEVPDGILAPQGPIV